MRYQKIPVVVEAIKWDGKDSTFKEINDPAFNKLKRKISSSGSDSLFIETLEGTHEARLEDWIIQGVNGEIYPCKPDIFEKTYKRYE